MGDTTGFGLIVECLRRSRRAGRPLCIVAADDRTRRLLRRARLGALLGATGEPAVSPGAVLAGAAPVILPLFSPRSARLAADAVAGASARLLPVAISDAAAAAWAATRPEPSRVALRPEVAAMLAEVAAVAAEHSPATPG